MLIEKISAINSWEGYEYQCHIAINIVLDTILDCIRGEQKEEKNNVRENKDKSIGEKTKLQKYEK